MPEKAITVVSSWTTRSLYRKDGTMEYTRTRMMSEHLEFRINHGTLMLDKKVLSGSLKFDNNVLKLQETYPQGDMFVTEYHLRSPDRDDLEVFLFGEKKGG